MQIAQDAAVTAAEDLRKDQRDQTDEDATERRPRPAGNRQRPEQGFGRGHSLHDKDAKPSRGETNAEKSGIVGPRDRDFMADDKYRGRPDEPADHERPGQPRDPARGA